MNISELVQSLSWRITPVMVMAAAVGFVVAIVVITLLLQVLITNFKHSGRLRRFRRRMQALGLDERQCGMMDDMMRQECPAQPCAIVEDRLTFEKAVQRYMAHGRATAAGKELTRREEAVRSIREKLQFMPSGDAALFSTRGLTEGMELDIAVAMLDGTHHSLTGRVHRERDALLEVRLDSSPPDHLYGAMVQVAFFPGKSSFGFTTTVKDLDAEEQLLFLEHTLTVARVDKRRYERFQVNQPIELLLRDDGTQRHCAMTLFDISAGGAAFVSQDDIPVSEHAVFDVELASDRFAPDQRSPDMPDSKSLTCRVIRTSATQDGRTMYHCEFINVSRQDRQYLYHLTKLLDG